MESKSPDGVIEVKEPTTRMHQGVWASHSWSSHVAEDTRFVLDWERGNLVSLAYLREGKGFQILGAQLDFGYENPINTSAIVQWGPPDEKIAPSRLHSSRALRVIGIRTPISCKTRIGRRNLHLLSAAA